MSLVRWGKCALVWAILVIAAVSETDADTTTRVLEALESALTEEEARSVVGVYLDNLKDLDPQVVEKVVLRQWWGLARDIVAKSHTQQVDLSFAVRKAVRTLKDEADELLRTLNPKYGHAQQVSPAFQWAQNDTCIFLTIKYTVRWNAPGALEVTDPAVNISDHEFNFTGLGKHSNNKYKYWLSLSLFDLVHSQQSSWNAASVGKLSVTLRKRWPRKWPRLLADKKAKINNMHVWMEMQEKLDSSLSGMSTVSHSPVTCAMGDKLYCLATDTCKKAANCSQCPGKTIPKAEEHVCTGMPTEKASLSFKDSDFGENEIGGEVKIFKARNEFDIEAYAVYFGKDDRNKLETADGSTVALGEAAPTGADTELRIPLNTRIPEGATHLLVFSKNEYGEFATPGSVVIRDAVLPKAKPAGLNFEDDDGDKGEISGVVTVSPAETEAQLDEYSIHWGKSATRKLASNSHIRDMAKQDGKEVTHYISRNTKIPDGATHILAFAKNEHGEHPSPASVKVTDNTKPCLAHGDRDCPAGVQITADSDPRRERAKATVTVLPAADQGTVSHYVLHWGRQGCQTEGSGSNSKLGWIKDVPVGGDLTFELPADLVPEGTRSLLVFAKNKYGESDFCTSTDFEDKADEEKKEL